MVQTKQLNKKADHYNDPNHDYLKYWSGREYEHAAEQIAIQKLLKGKHFSTAVDVGGGYGRLCIVLENYADHIILAEPSQKQLDMAKKILKGHPNIERQLMQADNLQLPDSSVDLLTMIRVMHHLPDPLNELAEIKRVLTPNGLAIIEVANYAHFRNRMKHLIRRQRMPVKPVDIRSPQHRSSDYIPFVNHNPYTVVRQLAQVGLKVESALSVSNLRSATLKKYIPRSLMIASEHVLQRTLAGIYFGPSIFFLVRKAEKSPI